MTQIFAFRGITYNRKKVGDYSRILTQPYDKIDDKLQAVYYRKSKYNHIRITKPKKYQTDTETNSIYTRAAECFRGWLKSGVLVPDKKPTIYAYYQTYADPSSPHSTPHTPHSLKTRKGFIALGQLVEFGKGVHPHERTLLGPKVDRLNMMRAVGGSTGQIFMLYSDPKLQVNYLLDKAATRCPPDIIARDEYDVQHKVWKIQDQTLNKQISRLMVDKEVFIADGHHRYETALNYRNEMRAKGAKSIEPESYNNRMMTFINMDDTEGLSILPTHRLVYGLKGFSLGGIFRKLQKYFEVKEYPYTDKKSQNLARGDMLDDLRILGNYGHSFGMVVKGRRKYYLLTLRDEKLMAKVVKEKHSPAWKQLDVTILHSLVIEHLLGISKEKVAGEENIAYRRGADEVISEVEKGKYQLAFLMNPTRISEVKEVASKGEKMPQKSTDFYPKLLSGIVISKINFLDRRNLSKQIKQIKRINRKLHLS